MTLTPHLQRDGVTLYAGDCLDVLCELPDASVDAVVTDPPYGLEFMGKEWDGADGFRRSLNGADVGRDNVFGRTSRTSPEYRALHTFQQWCELWAAECLRILKPGGHLLAFGGSRTWHRLAAAVEDAGFEIRDSIAWLYGSGFPKSLDVSKAIDKAAGSPGKRGPMKRGGERLARLADGARDGGGTWGDEVGRDPYTYVADTPAAEQWQGWGTALKPAFEPVVVGRKPLAGTVAANVLAHGTGAMNIDACRIDGGSRPLVVSDRRSGNEVFGDGLQGSRAVEGGTSLGRWPANVILDESQAAALDEQSGIQRDGVAVKRNGGGSAKAEHVYAGGWGSGGTDMGHGGGGGASRFFYVAKADATERPRVDGVAHPTVKPLALMRWLVRLVTPPGGKVLEPFAGSGTTVEACIVEGFECVAIEREPDYLPLIEARVARRRDVVRAIKLAGADEGLFAFDDDEEAG